MNAIGELLGVRDARNLGFHPDKVGVGRIGTSTLNAIIDPSTELVIPFSNTAEFPIKINLVICKGDRIKQNDE